MRTYTAQDIQTVRDTNDMLRLQSINRGITTIGWVVDQLARIHDLNQGQIYSAAELSDRLSLEEVAERFHMLDDCKTVSDVAKIYGIDITSLL